MTKEEFDEMFYYLEDLMSRFPKKLDDYFLEYSGGRDSHFLLWFIKHYMQRDIEVISVNTYMEHEYIRKRMYANADVVLIPKMKPFDIKAKYGSPCFSKQQDEYIERYQHGSRTENTMKAINGENTFFNLNSKARNILLDGNLHKVSNKCCMNLKHKPMNDYSKKIGKKPILAVRGDESKTRKAKYTSCFSKNGTFHPLYDLSNEMLRRIEEVYNIEVPDVYNYLDRTGCMGCPYGHNIQKEVLLLNGNQKNFVFEYFKESYQVLGIDRKKIENQGLQTTIFDYLGE